MIREYLQYINDNPNRYWFRRKIYGWGWTPATKEGWIVTLIYVALVIVLGLTLDETAAPQEIAFMFFIPVTLLTASLIRICYAKGEKPKWQWGIKRSLDSKENDI